MLIDEAVYLDHHGTKGMHWGVRKKTDSSGLSRTKRAVLDRNQRLIDIHQKAISRTGSKSFNLATGVDRILIGKKRFEKMHNVRIAKLSAQTKRIETGKLLIRDKLDVMNTPVAAIFLEKKPK